MFSGKTLIKIKRLEFIALLKFLTINLSTPSIATVDIRADNGSADHGSWVKWVDKCELVTWVTCQYGKQLTHD